LKHVGSLLLPGLEQIVDQGSLPPPEFIRTLPVPAAEAKAVAAALERFYRSDPALAVRFNEMTILGVIDVWTYLMC
jgi:hypothetical protein